MAQDATELQRRGRCEVADDHIETDREIRFARDYRDRNDTITEVAGKDADLATAIVVFEMGGDLVMQLEPAEQ